MGNGLPWFAWYLKVFVGFKFVSSHAVFNTILLDIWVTVYFLLVILEMEALGTFQSNKQTKIKAAANDVMKTPVEHAQVK